jgi:quercetin dioxygenase-like cupin family protein
MASDMRAILLAPGEGETVRNPVGGPLTFKVGGDQTNGTLAAFESIAAPGEGPPLHVHRNEEEVWYALTGAFRVKLGDEVHAAPAGTFVFIPRGVVHTWQNVGTAPAHLLVLVTPAGFEAFFKRFAESTGAESAAERFRALAGPAGMEVVGPPLAESDPM